MWLREKQIPEQQQQQRNLRAFVAVPLVPVQLSAVAALVDNLNTWISLMFMVDGVCLWQVYLVGRIMAAPCHLTKKIRLSVDFGRVYSLSL